MKNHCLLSALALLLSFTHALAAAELKAIKTEHAPVTDGIIDDLLWQNAPSVTHKDGASDTYISIRALYDDEFIYLLAQFRDNSESRRHKPAIWNETVEIYQVSTEREDTLILKWDMGEAPTDLTLHSDVEYRADVWYWKANRTDPAGYADDKFHIYSRHLTPKSRMLTSQKGALFYLTREGDAGKAAYQTSLKGVYEGDTVNSYQVSTPSGSRGDIRAKGHWQQGIWTIEFKRKMLTNNSDDIQFSVDKTFAFAMSRFEIAGREPNPKLSQPLHGAGEVGPVISLKFE